MKNCPEATLLRLNIEMNTRGWSSMMSPTYLEYLVGLIHIMLKPAVNIRAERANILTFLTKLVMENYPEAILSSLNNETLKLMREVRKN